MIEQYAYQPKIGTVDALLQLRDDITTALDGTNTKYVQLASLDFSKAFDCVQPHIVVEKMENDGFKTNIIKLISNFLKHRRQHVKYRNGLSEVVDIEVGAPQGTRIGPLLWLIYINDFHVDGFQSVKYANDPSFYLTVPKQSEGSIVPAIHQRHTWSDNNNMQLNTDKTSIVNF